MTEFSKIKLQMVKTSPTIFTLDKLTTSQEVVDFINKIERLDLSPNKKLIEIGLDCKNNIIMYTEITTGGIHKMHVSVADTFKPLLVSNCSRFILAHNNVSGDPTPSTLDKEIARKIKQASEIIGVELLDYLIIADENEYRSILKEI